MKQNYSLTKGWRKFILTTLLLTFGFAFNNFNAYSQSWNALTTGTNGSVYATAIFNGQLIVAGTFTMAGGVPANNIAAWNGTTWSALGTGTDGFINALTIFNGQLIAGGTFTTAGGTGANNIARWSGTTWFALGLGTNGNINALTVYSGSLRAGGDFTTAGGVAANRIARFDGTNWFAMGAGTNATVWSLALYGADLIIGGSFTMAGGVTNNRIVRYNSGSGNYTAMGTGIDNGSVYAMLTYGANLSVGGSFTTIGGSTVNRIARWTGTNWTTQGSGMNGNVWSFTLNGANLIVGGSFTNAGGTPANAIAVWNGTTHTALGPGITGGGAVVYTSNTYSNALYAGGNFTNAGLDVVSANNIAAWGSIPVAPTLISPPNNSIGISVTPLLDWSDVAGASTYGVQLSANLTFVPLLINVSGLVPSQYQVGAGVLANNTNYFWRATATNGIGTSPFSSIFLFRTSLVGIININEIPATFSLYQNYPNPFNPTTKIKFDLPQNNKPAKVLLEVYNAQGQVVKTLLNEDYVAGKWEIDFDASGLASGFYFYKINAGDFNSVNKMILIK